MLLFIILIISCNAAVHWPGISHENEGHDGEEHEGEEDEEGEVDGAADVVGERRRGFAQLLRVERAGTSTWTLGPIKNS